MQMCVFSVVAKGCKNPRGFTFIEVLLALVIVGVAMIPVLTLFKTSTGHLVTGQRESRAVFLAQARLDQVKSCRYENVRDEPRTPCPENDMFEYAVDVEPQGQAKKITVTVYYPGSYGAEREVVLSTVRAAR